MVAEKNLRGSLRSEVDRAVGKDRIVIVDSLNAIKGYRYELWCLARAAATKYCVVHCDVAAETAREWNDRRREGGEPCYAPHVLEDLLGRFERPVGRNRWDSPLFELHPATEQAAEEAERVIGEVVRLLVGGSEAANGQGRAGRALQPTVATQTATASDANVLYEMDRATKVWDRVEVPTWADIVKTGTYKELAPYDPDWYYIRAASMARKVYLKPGVGVGAFKKIYGGPKNNGSRPSHFCRSSGSIARHVLQQLESIGIVEQDANGGRRITSDGQRDLDRIAGRAAAAAVEGAEEEE
ncbi:unnamed protein product [Closterium sp. NIES-53]